MYLTNCVACAGLAVGGAANVALVRFLGRRSGLSLPCHSFFFGKVWRAFRATSQVYVIQTLSLVFTASLLQANYHDFVLASTEARFLYPFAKLGLTPELGSSYVLPRVAGMAKAKKALMSGEWFSAEEALEVCAKTCMLCSAPA